MNEPQEEPVHWLSVAVVDRGDDHYDLAPILRTPNNGTPLGEYLREYQHAAVQEAMSGRCAAGGCQQHYSRS